MSRKLGCGVRKKPCAANCAPDRGGSCCIASHARSAEQAADALPGVAGRGSRGFRHRITVHGGLGAGIVGGVYQGNHRLGRLGPCRRLVGRSRGLRAEQASASPRSPPFQAWPSPARSRRALVRALPISRPRGATRRSRPAALSTRNRRACLWALPATSGRTPRRRRSIPDRWERAWPWPSIRARGRYRRARLPRARPSARPRGASAPRHRARARHAPSGRRAHRARRARRQERLRAGRASWRQAAACARAARARCRRSADWHRPRRCRGAD